ncbi:MAG: FMN-binding negative transcriptional regulator [Bacteroidota bacterium]
MYISKLNRNEKTEELHEFIRQNGFAILISNVEGKPWASHVPLLLSIDGKKLSGHVARGNKQWKEWNAETEILAIFTGPHSYISSSWYDHENVPTWNYIAVHVYGKLKILSDQELLQSLKELTDTYEKSSGQPVTVEQMNPVFVKKEMLGIVGFDIDISHIEAAYKLSQNRDAKNHEAIIAQLEKRNDPASNAIAQEMKKAGHS